MMGARTPETCWAVNKRLVINWRNWCIWLVDLFELYDDARTCKLYRNFTLSWNRYVNDLFRSIPPRGHSTFSYSTTVDKVCNLVIAIITALVGFPANGQIGSLAHTFSYSMGTGAFFPGRKAAWTWIWPHLHLVPRLRVSGSYTSTPPYAFMSYTGTAYCIFSITTVIINCINHCHIRGRTH